MTTSRRWTAVLFVTGSLCFLVGPLPFFLDLVGAHVDALVFFVGSLFFTAAATLQMRTSLRARSTPATGAGRSSSRSRDLDLWSSGVQLAGTLFFNLSTYQSMDTALTSADYNQVVWRPDAFGSVCFLVSGCLAYAVTSGRLLTAPPHSADGAIASSNLFGCLAFGVSAVGAFVVPQTAKALDAAVANAGTAVGALAFLIGALLLLPDRTSAPLTSPGR